MSYSPALPVIVDTLPARFKRDEDGLIAGLQYHYTPEGRIDWRAMVSRRYLYIAREYEDRVVKAQGKPLAEVDYSLVNPKWLRIRIDGINQIANIRGYSSLEYHSLSVGEGHAAVVCQMQFIGNYESDGYPVICSGIASARRMSMDKNMMGYLEAFAENRAFARCVKRALQIEILADIEVGGDGKPDAEGEDDAVSAATGATGFNPYDKLRELCMSRKKPISFEVLKAGAIAHNAELAPDKQDERIQGDPATWVGFESIQGIDAWLLISKIKTKDAAANKGK